MIGRTDFITRALPAGDRPNTREVVYAEVISAGDTLHTFVNHWPSRGGGQMETEPNRLTIAEMVKSRLDALRKNKAEVKILLMGDFNDYPQNKSIREILQASAKTDWPMYNLMESFDKAGEGTYNYKGDWGTLDQFIISNSLLYANQGFSANENSAEIFDEDFVMYFDKDGNKSPSRTYGREYYGGYSDHLAIICRLQIK
jgi:predicted extracellular nuclease